MSNQQLLLLAEFTQRFDIHCRPTAVTISGMILSVWNL